jgi:hypothetical protein
MVRLWGAKVSILEAEMTYEPSDGQQDIVLHLHSVNVVPNRRSEAYRIIMGYGTNRGMYLPHDMDDCFCLMVAASGTEDFFIARQLQAVDQQGQNMGPLCEAGTKFRLQVPVRFREQPLGVFGNDKPMEVHLVGTERSKSELSTPPRS